AACCACAGQRSGREKPWGHEAEVLGKPNPAYARLIAEWHGLDLRRTVMVGDRLDTDIEMG
ncbi:Pdxp, partial [Symbiodinium microadriaticum]